MATSLALALSACHDQAPPEQQEQSEPELDARELATRTDAKLEGIAGCRDQLATAIRDSWRRYDEQVDELGVPRRAAEGVFVRPLARSLFRTCKQVQANAPVVPPRMFELEQALDTFVAAAEAYAGQTFELATYLESTGVKREGWAELTRLAPALKEAHEAWEAADADISEQLAIRRSLNDPVLLGVLSQEDPLEFRARALMIRARPLVRCLTLNPAPEPATCEPHWAAFDESFVAFRKAYEPDQLASDRIFWMSTFANDVSEFHELASEHQRYLGSRRARDPNDLSDAHAGLVRDANTLHFDFP